MMNCFVDNNQVADKHSNHARAGDMVGEGEGKFPFGCLLSLLFILSRFLRLGLCSLDRDVAEVADVQLVTQLQELRSRFLLLLRNSLVPAHPPPVTVDRLQLFE